MNPILDTLVWLVAFPATHAYEMVFVGGFSIAGILGIAARKGPRHSRLDRMRIERGMASDELGAPTRLLQALRSWFARALALVIGSGLVIAIASLIFGPITNAYIGQHGVQAVASLENDIVSFTAEDGTQYRLRLPFFSPPAYPDRDAFITSSDQLVVRYLPGHPQAYVVDTAESLDTWGDPLGD